VTVTHNFEALAATNLSGIWAPAVQQRNFRKILGCMARPGTIGCLEGMADGEGGHLALLAVLLDHSVTLADPCNWLTVLERSRLEAPPTDPEKAQYILVPAEQAVSFEPSLGTLASPEFGATIILVGGRIGQGNLRFRLKGPGIAGTTELALAGFAPDWFIRRHVWVQRFPLGVDFILADETRIAALPRTTNITGDFPWPM
jgi:alpha-D-ribose 1-methylphosphonate 5-triphosphate synthase subunit PhnH